MTREQCMQCGFVFSTTGTPNNEDGYFVSEVVIDKHDFRDESDDRVLNKFLREEGGIPCHKCPRCGIITIRDDKYYNRFKPKPGEMQSEYYRGGSDTECPNCGERMMALFTDNQQQPCFEICFSCKEITEGHLGPVQVAQGG